MTSVKLAIGISILTILSDAKTVGATGPAVREESKSAMPVANVCANPSSLGAVVTVV